jgi:hypothetical protein
MNNPSRVRGIETRRDLTDDLRGSLEADLCILKHSLETGARNVLHGDVHLAALEVLAYVEDPNDVRMVDAARGLGNGELSRQPCDE